MNAQKTNCSTLLLFLLSVSTLFFTSCQEYDFKEDLPPAVATKPNIEFYAVNSLNQLLKFNANAVGTPMATLSVSGLQTGETIEGIDFRPATGELYALTNASRLYVLNTTTGRARMVSSNALSPTTGGNFVGFDFNPTVDRIRVVTSSGQNLRVHPETGAVVATDGAISGVPNAAVSAVAYTGNTAGSTTTVLYDIDLSTQKLYRQDPPNNGTLVEVGSLGITGVNGLSGFDISPNGSVALAALNVGEMNGLYQVDLNTGQTSFLGRFELSGSITGIAIPTNPVSYAVDNQNNLLIFDHTATAAPISKPITGLMAGENITGLDFRPLNGQLYALGSTSRLYTINPSSGGATMVGTAPLSTLLSGSNFGFDFNPTVDRIRVVSDNGQNLRLHPETGGIAAVDGLLNPGTPSVSAAAYTNNFAGATTTVLYDIDHTTDRLLIQNPPNNGTLVDVGPLGINITAANGFDIGSTSGNAYAILTAGSTTSLYRINLSTGAATKVSDFTTSIRGFTIGLGF